MTPRKVIQFPTLTPAERKIGREYRHLLWREVYAYEELIEAVVGMVLVVILTGLALVAVAAFQ